MNKTIFYPDALLTTTLEASPEYITVPLYNNEAISIRPILSLKEMTDLVQNMLKACEAKQGILAPELIDFSFRLFIVSAYSLVEMPEEVEKQYQLLYMTNLFDIVVANINPAQYQGMIRAINLYVGFELF